MSDSEEEEMNRKKGDEVPPFNMRFTDFPPNLVEKAVKRKFISTLLTFFLSSRRQVQQWTQVRQRRRYRHYQGFCRRC